MFLAQVQVAQRNSVVGRSTEILQDRKQRIRTKMHFTVCIFSFSSFQSGVYGPVVVHDDARIEEDGRRSIATQTRTFPLEYVPASEAMHAATQTTTLLESIGFTRSVLTCSLVLSEYSETSFSRSSWFPHLFLIASIGF